MTALLIRHWHAVSCALIALIVALAVLAWTPLFYGWPPISWALFALQLVVVALYTVGERRFGERRVVAS